MLLTEWHTKFLPLPTTCPRRHSQHPCNIYPTKPQCLSQFMDLLLPNFISRPFSIYVTGRTFPRVTSDGWRVAGDGQRVTGSGWRVVGQAIKNKKRDTFHPNPNVSPATPHPPPTTRNPPPVTRHPLPAEKSCRLRTRPCEQGFQHYLTFRE